MRVSITLERDESGMYRGRMPFHSGLCQRRQDRGRGAREHPRGDRRLPRSACKRRHAGTVVSLSVPDHAELAPGTLRKLIRFSGVTLEEFVNAVRNR
jgi:hypothetical protein